MTSQLKAALGKKIAPILRNAIGSLNHTHIGYASDHDHMADPFIDDILDAIQPEIERLVVEAEKRGGMKTIERVLIKTGDWSAESDMGVIAICGNPLYRLMAEEALDLNDKLTQSNPQKGEL